MPNKNKKPMQKLRKSNGELCNEYAIAKALNLALIQFKTSGKFWATAIPKFYLKSKDVKLIKDFSKSEIKSVEFGVIHKPNEVNNFLNNLLTIY